MKEVSDEDYILWKSAEWNVSEEEARRIIEGQKPDEYHPYFWVNINKEAEILF